MIEGRGQIFSPARLARMGANAIDASMQESVSQRWRAVVYEPGCIVGVMTMMY